MAHQIVRRSALLCGIGGFVCGLSRADDDGAAAVCAPMRERVSSLEARLSGLEVAAASRTHAAFVFIKPHAADAAPVASLVRTALGAAGIAVRGEGVLGAAEMDAKRLIDTHYGAIASKAMRTDPRDLNPTPAARALFASTFAAELAGMGDGIGTWEEAVAAGRVRNAVGACSELGIDAAAMDGRCRERMVKFGGGFYCSLVDGIFVINGFYMAMRAKYCAPGEKIRFLRAEWDADRLSWADFRGATLGATNPAAAAEGSLRRSIYDGWADLGLGAQPSVGDNGVHASASPFEAMAERVNWLEQDLGTDVFGAGLLAAGIPEATVRAWMSDPQVPFEGGRQSLFDLLEDLDARDCLAKAKQINAAAAAGGSSSQKL